jgi:hypothetical protein
MYDEKGTLLYVGVSYNAIRRLTGHRHTASEWIDSVKWIEIERFETYDSALMAEKLAIRQERPLHNVIHSDIRTSSLPDPKTFRLRLENLLQRPPNARLTIKTKNAMPPCPEVSGHVRASTGKFRKTLDNKPDVSSHVRSKD